MATLATMPAVRRRKGAPPWKGAARCRRKFLEFYPDGFEDESYVELERSYKWAAHERWEEMLGRDEFRRLIRAGEFVEAASRAVKIESRTNLLFSFEKMALRDAVKSAAGAEGFARGLYEFLHGGGELETRFQRWIEAVGALPRRQTRVLTWPVVTVWGFIAQPDVHVYLKPTVTKLAARAYGFEFEYESRPNWWTYASLLSFAKTVMRGQRALRPRDMIDAQGFIWVQGSDEYS